MIEKTTIQETSFSGHYIILPGYSIAIPKTGNTQETLASFLANKGDFTTSQELDTFPSVTREILLAHFSGYAILPVLAEITRSYPERMETFLQRSVRRAQEGKIRAQIQRDKSRFDRKKAREARGIMDVSGIFD